MSVSGVRNSWLTFEKNCVFARASSASASALALERAGVRQTRRDLAGDEVDEADVALVELAIRVGRGNEEARGSFVRGLRDRHDDGLTRRDVPRTGW